MSSPFLERLRAATAGGRMVCVGLDGEVDKLPAHLRGHEKPLLAFNTAIVEATADVAAAYKPNSAFYEAHGPAGLAQLVETVVEVRRLAPHAVVVLDAKRGDIGSTNEGYATFAFDVVGADAITFHPYLGSASAESILRDPARGVFVLCRTSNPGAGELQDLPVRLGAETMPLYGAVARTVQQNWNAGGNCGLVVGATYPRELAEIRALAPELPLLVPGVGAQGGDVAATVKALAAGDGPVLVNSSRGVIYASPGTDFAAAARAAAVELDAQLRQPPTT